MKIRRKADAHSPRKQAERLLRQVVQAYEQAPIEVMAELIALGKEDEGAREEIMGLTVAAFRDDPGTLFPCWLSLMVGELSASDVPLLLYGIGTAEGDALNAAIIASLIRRSREIMDEIGDAMLEADKAKDDLYRSVLYDCLHGVILAGDEAEKARLREYALVRHEVERRHPKEESALSGPLFILAALGHPGTAELVAEARGLSEPGNDLAADLDDIDSVLAGQDLLDFPRHILATDWRDTARDIEELAADEGGTCGASDGDDEDD
jgi:hypothetical protein